MKSAMKVAVVAIALVSTSAMAHMTKNEDNTSSDPTKMERMNKSNPDGTKYKHKYHGRNRNIHSDDGAWQSRKRDYADQRGTAADYRYNTSSNYNYGDIRNPGSVNAPVYKGKSFWYNGQKRTWLGMKVDAYDYPEMNDINLVKHAH